MSAVRPYVRASVRTYIHSVPYENSFCSLSFEKGTILDSCFMLRYIIIKIKVNSIWGEVHHLFWEFWPFCLKMVSVRYL